MLKTSETKSLTFWTALSRAMTAFSFGFVFHYFFPFPPPPPPFFFFFFFQLLNSSRSGYLCIHLFFSIFLGYFFPSCFFAFLFFFFKIKCPFIQNYTIYIFYFLIFFFNQTKKFSISSPFDPLNQIL